MDPYVTLPAMGTRAALGSPWVLGATPTPWRALDRPLGEEIDHHRSGWPVRFQGLRATCAAFAVSAMMEHAIGGDLSAQFLYWAAKERHDADPADGTTLAAVRDALASSGICEEAAWGYNPFEVLPHPVGDPPAPERAVATAARMVVSLHRARSAAAIHAALRRGPVPISVPVFGSDQGPRTNWNGPRAFRRGWVDDPPPGSVVVDGHTFLLVGYVPDDAGGRFVLRNSWGPSWGRDGTPADRLCPDPGYGSISARYLDQYTWEWLTR